MTQIARLPENDLESISPISYTIVLDRREHKMNYHIEFSGDKQVMLCGSDGALVEFSDESKAEAYCLVRWPSLRKI